MKRHPVPAWIRSQNQYDKVHTRAGRHCANPGTMAGHYGALYWALAAFFTSDGAPSNSPATEASAARGWECEVTGGGCRPFRPMHTRLYRAALKVARLEYREAVKIERKRAKKAAA